jgi:hypothetical protein
MFSNIILKKLLEPLRKEKDSMVIEVGDYIFCIYKLIKLEVTSL